MSAFEQWFGKNAEQRDENLRTAADVLERWIHNLIQQGLGRVDHPDQETIATRLTDLQAGSLAQRVRELDFSGNSADDWEHLLEELGVLQLWCKAIRKPDWNDSFALSLRQWAGVNIRKSYVEAEGKQQAGVWHVWGTHVKELETGLRAQRVWLQEAGGTNWGLLLDFAFGQNTLATQFEVGALYELKLAFYPNAVPLRAVVLEESGLNLFTAPPTLLASTEEILLQFSSWLSRWPWLEQMPTGWDNVRIQKVEDRWYALDLNQEGLPLSGSQKALWQLLAFSAGDTVQLFGEWDGTVFLPLFARDKRGRIWIST